MVSEYFKDPINFDGGSRHPIDLGGSPTVAPQRTLNPLPAEREPPSAAPEVSPPAPPASASSDELLDKLELRELDLLLQELQNKIETDPVLQRFKEQILMEFTLDGLRIQIVDADNRPMFASGSPDLQPYFEDILLALTDTIAKVPKKISISGHTDAEPYVGRHNYGNWELSAQRANAARRTLQAAGYPENQVARVVGYADSALFDPEHPLNPINRRIDIVVMNKRAERATRRQAGGGAKAEEKLRGALDDPAEQAEPAVKSPLSTAPQAPTEAADSSEQAAPDSDADADDKKPATRRPRNLFEEPEQVLPLKP